LPPGEGGDGRRAGVTHDVVDDLGPLPGQPVGQRQLQAPHQQALGPGQGFGGAGGQPGGQRPGGGVQLGGGNGLVGQAPPDGLGAAQPVAGQDVGGGPLAAD